ncbi:hypothetical protein FKM82_020394 [Ascaphus truei]
MEQLHHSDQHTKVHEDPLPQMESCQKTIYSCVLLSRSSSIAHSYLSVAGEVTSYLPLDWPSVGGQYLEAVECQNAATHLPRDP